MDLRTRFPWPRAEPGRKIETVDGLVGTKEPVLTAGTPGCFPALQDPVYPSTIHSPEVKRKDAWI